MKRILQVISVLLFIVGITWMIFHPGFDALVALLTGLLTFLTSTSVEQVVSSETIETYNRRVMLDHVEAFWVKGVLEKSLHGAALLELGIKESPDVVTYPWSIIEKSTNETLPANKSMLEIFQGIGLGRSLLVLGAPGTGKTTMMLELVRQLVDQARLDDSEPIPLVFNLASWREQQSLMSWLEEQLHNIYFVPRKNTDHWIVAGKVFLLLDGLDEVKKGTQKKCVEAINNFRAENGLIPIVICSRQEDYSSLDVKLAFNGAIVLQLLNLKQISSYLNQFGKSLAGLKQLLRKDHVFRELAETPLMLSIMAMAFNNVSEPSTQGNIEEQRKNLFDMYLSRMFVRTKRNTWYSKDSTLCYLHSLAQIMVNQNLASFQIENLQFSWLNGKGEYRSYYYLIALSGLLVSALIIFLQVLLGLTHIATPLAAVVGVTSALLIFNKKNYIMADLLRWSWRRGRSGLFIGVSIGTVIGGLMNLMGMGFVVNVGQTGLGISMSAVFFMLFTGLSLLIIQGFTGEHLLGEYLPGQRLRNATFVGIYSTVLMMLLLGSFFHYLYLWAIMYIVFWVILWASNWQISTVTFGSEGAIIGAGIGFLLGLNISLASILQHYALRAAMARNNVLPIRLVSFLDYCTDLILLQRVGSGYIFIHRLLLEYFATLSEDDIQRVINLGSPVSS